MTAIDLSGDMGQAALALLTINILLGLLLSVRYDPLRSWPHRQVDVFDLHNWTGYVALVATALHPLPLLATARLRFTWEQILWPVHAPTQAWGNLMGALALYGVALVVLSSYFRRVLGRQRWKFIHYTSYAAAILFFLHSLVLDPELLNRPVEWLDAEKVFVEACLLLVLAATFARWRYGQAHPQRLRVTPRTRSAQGFPGERK